MAEYRTIRMSFWNDPYIESLSPYDKLLYIYLFTSPHTNNLGLLDISRKKIAFETGLTQEQVERSIGIFVSSGKIVVDGTKIWMSRFIKHQTTTSEKLISSLKRLISQVDSQKLICAIRLQYPQFFSHEDTLSIPQNTLSIPQDTLSIPPGELELELEREFENEEKEETPLPPLGESAPEDGSGEGVGDESPAQVSLPGVEPGSKPKKHRAKAKTPLPEWDDDFLTFYDAYPRHDGKADAQKAWRSMNGKRPPLSVLLEDLDTRKDSPQWTKDGGQFIPYPATYLRGMKWEDKGADVSRSARIMKGVI